ncbi:MAG TPA: glycine betaine ABC transporter substrate-binding protein [bacterium]|nr:glycine betaine ABC transporter substrate-binding protein [bacterium]
MMRKVGLVAGVILLALMLLAPAVSQVYGQGTGKPTVSVGSKSFTEQLIVGNMVAQLLESKGYPVNRKLGLASTAIVHAALLKGDVDVYVEYTGTGLVTILKQPVIGDPQAAYDAVKKMYAEQFHLIWAKPWGFNNTYALMMRQSDAERLKIKSISDLRSPAKDLILGSTIEFASRPDGIPGLTKQYGLAFKDTRAMDPGLVYQAIASRQVDIISGFSTDGRVPQLKLAVLQDDQKFFPPYYAAPVLRADLVQKSPIILEVLNRLAGKINDSTMAKLNFDVDGNRRSPEEVAAEYLKGLHLITK